VDDNGNGNRSMLAEVEVLGHLRHSNIVWLLGWCTDGEATLLLYEYMPNGSLDNLLHGAADAGAAGKAGLDWDALRRITVGMAQGVSYLHHDCVPAVAHRDLKPSNILLDADMEARVADYMSSLAVRRGGRRASWASRRASVGRASRHGEDAAPHTHGRALVTHARTQTRSADHAATSTCRRALPRRPRHLQL